MSKYAYYAVTDSDGVRRVCHAVIGRQPVDAVEISQDEANTISAALRANAPLPSPPAGYVTRDEAEALAQKAAQEAIAKFAASVINPTGG